MIDTGVEANKPQAKESICNDDDDRCQWLRSTAVILSCAALLVPHMGCASSSRSIAVVVTSDDQSQRLAKQPDIHFNFSEMGSGGNIIYVDEHQTYQQIEGFGAAFTDSAAYLLNEIASPSARDKALRDLFTRAGDGIGLSFMRNPMGATDIARSVYSFDDNDGQADPDLSMFSIAHDRVDIIPIILQAKGFNPQLRIMANPWSPPGWMKTSGTMLGGSLLPNMNSVFSGYFIKYFQAYAAEGISIDYLSLQNEPLYDVTLDPNPYPGMLMDPATQSAVLHDYLLSALAANGIGTKVLIYDHRWTDPYYPEDVFGDPTVLNSSEVVGIAWHGYAGTPGVMSPMQNLYSGKGQYLTEHSGFTTDSDHVRLDFENITQIMRNWSKAYVKWSVALDQNQGPHTGGCATCTPLVTVENPSGIVSYTIEYYTMGHFSKYVLPGAIRVYSSNAAGIIDVAFLNPDTSEVLVAFNDTTITRPFQVQWGDQSFSYTLQGLSGATFTWEGAQVGSYTVSARSQIQASSFNSTGGDSQSTIETTFGLQTENTSDANGGYDVGSSSDGDYAVYNNIDFGSSGVGVVNVRLACDVNNGGNCGGTVEFHLDSLDGLLAGSVSIPATGGWQVWSTETGTASGATGVHDLYVIFRSPASGTTNLGSMNWFQFN